MTILKRALSPASPPSIFDRRIAHPAVFLSAVLIGLTAAMRTWNIPRTASLMSTLIPAASGIVVWVGLLGMRFYAELRWPWATPHLLRAWIFVGFAFVAAGIILVSRAVSFTLIQIGLWSAITALATLATDPPADGES